MLSFSLPEAINQTISAVTTLIGVYFGGRLALRYGIQQIRRQKALERRIESQERILTALAEYQIALRVFISETSRPIDGTQKQVDFRAATLRHATEKGRELRALLPSAELYCTENERAKIDSVSRAQFEAYIGSWTVAMPGETGGGSIGNLPKVVDDLESLEEHFRTLVRAELLLPPLPRRAVVNKQVPTTL